MSAHENEAELAAADVGPRAYSPFMRRMLAQAWAAGWAAHEQSEARKAAGLDVLPGVLQNPYRRQDT